MQPAIDESVNKSVYDKAYGLPKESYVYDLTGFVKSVLTTKLPSQFSFNC